MTEGGFVRDHFGQEQGLHRSLRDDDPRGMVRAGETSQVRNGGGREINFRLIVGGQSGSDLELDDGRRATEEVDDVGVEREGGRKGLQARIVCHRVENPAGVCVEEECERGELGHLLEGFGEEGIECVRLLMVDSDGEGANVGGDVWTCGEGVEDGEVAGRRGNGDGSVERALCHGVEGVVCVRNGDEIGGGEEGADGIQELWRERERGHGVWACRGVQREFWEEFYI